MKENAIEVMDRRTLVFEALKNDIINGNIRFGEKINENEYSIRYNISRTPLREALSKLEMMGIIERVPFKGVFLKKFNSEKVKEIYEIRLELEYIIYKEIKEIMTDKHIKKVEKIVAKGQKYNNSNNLAKFSETLEEFDNYLYSLSKKELSLKILSELSFYMNIFKKTNPNMQETVDEHEKIIEALKEKDDEKIYKALEEHLYNAANYVVKTFDKISI
ncbi:MULTISPECIES: GntR family transcriptional regulator [Fusobacterium]|jgi:DNA-binding GntR family transcriptional regulator|uniref:GntR family transcriptional regulator n=1 Tax=Fusobacterium varium ATCC 27725 TaxID=469618 RepID=A0ABN5JMT0_FUSVA|nr:MULTISPECIES: GntR family transcriptional regulator [Fusobacterium]AVQ32478.1 GntR family transcriptional regulator [Fusobacterium varium ATCC 27725]EES64420.1 transcriptional regulator, GntR family [Fusobacterium varium ATCC 27725]MCF0169887.1 GntR family transcriptional regulator [Fusobacterium varium]MCF2672825.1 GntR family transcriptional regulator [Fusobacterium varium]MCI6033780.1 GntR family transcriptional regulator [Fusobacterium varium]